MLNQTIRPILTLAAAIELQITKFAEANESFSVHDITRAIRGNCNNNTWEIPEVKVSGASIRHDIPHGKVKDTFDALYSNGALDATLSLTRQFNGMYFSYVATLNSPGTPVASVAPSVVFPTQSPTQFVTSTSPTVPNAKPDRQEIGSRVAKYLMHCEAKMFRPSLKQVQSAIKRGNHSTGWTCPELQEVIEDDLDYVVVANPDLVSSSQVVTD